MHQVYPAAAQRYTSMVLHTLILVFMVCQQYCQKHYSEYLKRSAATRGVDMLWRQPLQNSNNQAMLALKAVHP